MGCMMGLGLGIVFLALAIGLFILGAGKDGNAAFLAGAGACLLLAIAVPITIAVRQGNEDEKAMAAVFASGLRVEAVIVDVRHGTAVNKSSAYRVIAQGQNPVTGQQQHFVGPSLRRDPGFHLRERKTITIAVDRADPTRGIMDFSFMPGEKPVGWTLCTSTLPTSHF